MAFDLSDYKTVAERIAELKQQYPNAVLQSRVVDIPIPGFIAVEARCYREPGDEIPGIGLAWEPVPGRTPYTKDSELQNAETSAWGRAIVAALVTDTTKGIASRDEVQHRVGDRDDAGRPPFRGANEASVPPTTPGPQYTCPKCQRQPVYDNRNENIAREAEGRKNLPIFKCMDPKCGWLEWDDEGYFDSSPVREDYEPFEYAAGEEPF